MFTWDAFQISCAKCKQHYAFKCLTVLPVPTVSVTADDENRVFQEIQTLKYIITMQHCFLIEYIHIAIALSTTLPKGHTLQEEICMSYKDTHMLYPIY
jgi:hypothetical protein